MKLRDVFYVSMILTLKQNKEQHYRSDLTIYHDQTQWFSCFQPLKRWDTGAHYHA